MSERTIHTERDLRRVLASVTFAPSCVDMGWQWTVNHVDSDRRDGWLVSTTFRRPDRDTGAVGAGRGREWYIERGTTESGVVKTAYAAAKMILEHELAESFRYRGVRIFDPHHTVEELSLPSRARDR